MLLLSAAWGGSLLLGRCDINDQGIAVDKQLTQGWDLSRTGVTTDDDVRKGAAVMAASVVLYGIVQVPAFLGATNDPQVGIGCQRDQSYVFATRQNIRYTALSGGVDQALHWVCGLPGRQAWVACTGN